MSSVEKIRELIQTLFMIFIFIVILNTLLPEIAGPVIEIFRVFLDPELLSLLIIIAIIGLIFRDR